MENKDGDSSRRESKDEDSEDESEVLEESPCGRWLKRREEVENRVIPGIDASFLAMDTEEGVEVVWNEVSLKDWDPELSKAQEEKIKIALDQLIQLDHPNIVKMHKYWTDIRKDRSRVIFITEYMSSGSLKQFLKKTKRNVIKMSLPAWKRWCTQLLSALCYMHQSTPPIIHGNLSCDTICISHTGLIKIDAVAPNAIQRSLRWTRNDPPSNLHFVAPEINHCKDEVNCYVAPFPPPLTAAMDMYSFGICALEMAALEIPAEPESNHVTLQLVLNTIESLDNSLQKDFIKACISLLPSRRPSAKKLLFHPVLFEVPSLRLLSAHVIVNTPCNLPEEYTDEFQQKKLSPADTVVVETFSRSGQLISSLKVCDSHKLEIEKFLEEVRNGAYPLTALRPTYRQPVVSRHSLYTSESPETFEEELRRIQAIECDLKKCPNEAVNNAACNGLSIVLRMDDQMNRHISCDHHSGDMLPVAKLADELVHFGLINSDDRDVVMNAINLRLDRKLQQESSSTSSVPTTTAS